MMDKYGVKCVKCLVVYPRLPGQTDESLTTNALALGWQMDSSKEPPEWYCRTCKGSMPAQKPAWLGERQDNTTEGQKDLSTGATGQAAEFAREHGGPGGTPNQNARISERESGASST